MGRNKKYGNLILTDENRMELEKLANSQTAEYRKVQRAKIILMSADGMKNTDIAATISVHWIFQCNSALFPLIQSTPFRNGRTCHSGVSAVTN